MKVLLIDDDSELCDLLETYLVQDGFDVEVMNRFDENRWAKLADEIGFVVLDVGLPGKNGFEVLRYLRGTSKVPILMLTARGEDVDRIIGLEMGADDYLPKPCNPRELSARIRAIQRRVDGPQTTTKDRYLSVSGVDLDAGTRSVKRGSSSIQLTSTEFNVLERLMQRAGDVVSKEELTRDVLGRRMSSYDRAVDMHISSIRRKIGEGLVCTVRGVGYQFLLRK
ncbi:response regulator transcription factor [Pseudoxanthomonas sacheonensis]|uniref:Two-component system response regulator CpxR n=1 Tax=Pseudoxanthomonas sacheonensis TaxID=443615 RepID=A0ABU1RVH7_9GAMM|nr:response regulator transcription factor [Pseudoxanthomonas sacheonensis]MDR6842119.1 two-component system response regulator CpxR [Pseudoxanthomonas sacheonensis]